MPEEGYMGSKTQLTWKESYMVTVTVSQVAIGADDFDVDVAETLVANWFDNQNAIIIKDGVAGGGALEGRPIKISTNTVGNITFQEKVGANGLVLLTGDRIAICTDGLPPQDAVGGVTELFGEIASSSIPDLSREFYDGFYHGDVDMPARSTIIPIANKYEASIDMDLFNAKILGQGFGSISDDTTDYEAGGLSTTFLRNYYPGEDEIDITAYALADEGTDIVIKGGTSAGAVTGKPEIRNISYVYESIAFTLGGAVHSTEIAPGTVVTGSVSTKTAVVVRTQLTGGSWAAGTAAGLLILRTKSGALQAENLVDGTGETMAIGADSTEYALKLDKPLAQMHYVNANNDVKEVAETTGVPDTVIGHTLEIDDLVPTFVIEYAQINSRKYTLHDIVEQYLGLIVNSIELSSSPGSNPLQVSIGIQGLQSRDSTIALVNLQQRSSIVEVGFDQGVYKYSNSTVTINGTDYDEAGDFSAKIDRSMDTKITHGCENRPYKKAGDPTAHFPGSVTAEYSLTIPLRNRNLLTLIKANTAFSAVFRFTRNTVATDYLEIEFTDCYLKGPIRNIPEPGELPQTADATARKMKITVYDYVTHY